MLPFPWQQMRHLIVDLIIMLSFFTAFLHANFRKTPPVVQGIFTFSP